MRTLIFVIVLAAIGAPSRAEEPAEGGWSADLLQRILHAEPTRTEPAAAPAAEMVLHSYRLSHLRVGEAGKPQNVLAILAKLLPPGSAMNPDVPANTLHILTTAAAHRAVWDYLSAVDVAEPAAAPSTNTVPEEVKAALEKLARTGDESAKLLAAIGTWKADVSHELAAIDARQRQQTLRLVIGGASFLVLLGITVGWTLRRRTASTPPDAAPNAALVVAPEQLTTALTPVHDKLRGDMLGLLNEVAIKLQAQHHEQQQLVREQQKQLEDARRALAEERRQFISETGSMVVQAVERVDATTAKLAKQQDKVAELVQELQQTVRELDETKDSLRSKEIELEQERAKIAALSILLEDGGTPAVNGTGGRSPAATHSDSAATGHERAISATFSTPCTNPAPATEPLAKPGSPPPRFQFLPPDHPEN